MGVTDHYLLRKSPYQIQQTATLALKISPQKRFRRHTVQFNSRTGRSRHPSGHLNSLPGPGPRRAVGLRVRGGPGVGARGGARTVPACPCCGAEALQGPLTWWPWPGRCGDPAAVGPGPRLLPAAALTGAPAAASRSAAPRRAAPAVTMATARLRLDSARRGLPEGTADLSAWEPAVLFHTFFHNMGVRHALPLSPLAGNWFQRRVVRVPRLRPRSNSKGSSNFHSHACLTAVWT